jgi:hypothetical protein
MSERAEHSTVAIVKQVWHAMSQMQAQLAFAKITA